MTSTKDVECKQCGALVTKVAAEVNRSIRLGRSFFCNLSCAAKYKNRNKKRKNIEKKCPHCNKTFQSTTHNKAANFCSRSCASAGSMSDFRRQAQSKAGTEHKSNLLQTEETMKIREGWKYLDLKSNLEQRGRPHEFEYRIGNFIYDLVLFDAKTLIEFDGPEHNCLATSRQDQVKDAFAQSQGFRVIRRSVNPSQAIPLTAIEGL